METISVCTDDNFRGMMTESFVLFLPLTSAIVAQGRSTDDKDIDEVVVIFEGSRSGSPGNESGSDGMPPTVLVVSCWGCA
jgi:hypothetical protein